MTMITSGRGPIEFGSGRPTLLINAHLRVYDDQGLNETVLKNLLRGDFQIFVDRVQESIDLWDCKVVDICLDAHEIDEPSLLPEVAMAVHEATGLGLSLDTRDPQAIRRTLELYPHKAIINSIPGEELHIQNLFPLAAEFKTAVVLILTDEGHISKTVAGRLRVAERLLNAAEDHGIPLDDIIIDPVLLPPSAIENEMKVSLETLTAVQREFGCTTILGVTNAGFGMPAPGLLDQVYIMAAMAQGLDAILGVTDSPIIPLLYPSVMAMDFLTGRDPHGRAYISAFKTHPERFAVAPYRSEIPQTKTVKASQQRQRRRRKSR